MKIINTFLFYFNYTRDIMFYLLSSKDQKENIIIGKAIRILEIFSDGEIHTIEDIDVELNK